MKKKFLSAVLAVSLLATGCSNGEAGGKTSDVLRIGGLAPLTGEVSVYGTAVNNGIKMAIEEINTAGGVLGKQIEYSVLDELGDSKEAVTAYSRLVEQNKIAVLVGDVTSTPSIAVAQKAAADKIPMITPSGTAMEITQKGDNIFRTCFTDPYQGQLMAKYAYEVLGAKTATILYDNSDDYSTGLRNAFKEKAAELGLEILSDESYTKGDVDFKAQLTNIASKDADVFFLPVYYQDIALISVQAKNAGVEATMLGGDGWDGILGVLDPSNYSAVEGIYFNNHYSTESTDEKLQAFLASYKSTYGSDATPFAALGYDTVYMVKQAVETAFEGVDKPDFYDSAKITEALKNITYAGITGTIKFDENRNPVKTVSITTIKDGAYKFVETYSLEG